MEAVLAKLGSELCSVRLLEVVEPSSVGLGYLERAGGVDNLALCDKRGLWRRLCVVYSVDKCKSVNLIDCG